MIQYQNDINLCDNILNKNIIIEIYINLPYFI